MRPARARHSLDGKALVGRERTERKFRDRPIMKLLKNEFARYFAMGFAVSALAIVVLMGDGLGGRIFGEVVPAAIAATAH
jgi:hypothetical protein